MVEFEELKIKVRKETADNLRKIKEHSTMNEGEIIERALMEITAKSSDVAPVILLQNLQIVLSNLNSEEASKAFIDIVLTLLCSMPLNEEIMKALYERATELQRQTHGKVLSDTKDNQFVLDTIRELSK